MNKQFGDHIAAARKQLIQAKNPLVEQAKPEEQTSKELQQEDLQLLRYETHFN